MNLIVFIYDIWNHYISFLILFFLFNSIIKLFLLLINNINNLNSLFSLIFNFKICIKFFLFLLITLFLTFFIYSLKSVFVVYSIFFLFNLLYLVIRVITVILFKRNLSLLYDPILLIPFFNLSWYMLFKFFFLYCPQTWSYVRLNSMIIFFKQKGKSPLNMYELGKIFSVIVLLKLPLWLFSIYYEFLIFVFKFIFSNIWHRKHWTIWHKLIYYETKGYFSRSIFDKISNYANQLQLSNKYEIKNGRFFPIN
jgi:hypothetical protein